MTDPRRALRRLAIGLVASAGLLAQDDRPAAKDRPTEQEPHYVVRRYPRDKDEPIAVVGSRTLTLQDLLTHIDLRHYPGFLKLVGSTPAFERYLRSDMVAPWVRHFAQLTALQMSLGDTYVDPVELEKAQSESLKHSFEGWLKVYVENLQNRGLPTELSEQRLSRLLTDYQLQHGIAAEVQGMLDVLEKDDYSRGQLHDFFQANARFFGGQVTIAHILVQHRDAGNGILLKPEGVARANARIAEIKAQLKPDGSNFEQIARLYSEDTKTGPSGGLLPGVRRFDDRLPAPLCRAAWQLRDGEITDDVVETQYGYHFVKRVEFNQNIFVLFTDDAIPSIRIVMHRAMQEARLYDAIERVGVRLLL